MCENFSMCVQFTWEQLNRLFLIMCNIAYMFRSCLISSAAKAKIS
jgi:hypothetical protein